MTDSNRYDDPIDYHDLLAYLLRIHHLGGPVSLRADQDHNLKEARVTWEEDGSDDEGGGEYLWSVRISTLQEDLPDAFTMTLLLRILDRWARRLELQVSPPDFDNEPRVEAHRYLSEFVDAYSYQLAQDNPVRAGEVSITYEPAGPGVKQYHAYLGDKYFSGLVPTDNKSSMKIIKNHLRPRIKALGELL